MYAEMPWLSITLYGITARTLKIDVPPHRKGGVIADEVTVQPHAGTSHGVRLYAKYLSVIVSYQ